MFSGALLPVLLTAGIGVQGTSDSTNLNQSCATSVICPSRSHQHTVLYLSSHE